VAKVWQLLETTATQYIADQRKRTLAINVLFASQPLLAAAVTQCINVGCECDINALTD
jgi:hypothetical protein